MNQTVNCLYCGGEMPINSKACPHCGSDENTGWSEDRYLDGIDLPEEDDSYQQMREREFGGKKVSLSWQAVVGGLLLLTALIFVLQQVLNW